jgi:hypothetical protein
LEGMLTAVGDRTIWNLGDRNERKVLGPGLDSADLFVRHPIVTLSTGCDLHLGTGILLRAKA